MELILQNLILLLKLANLFALPSNLLSQHVLCCGPSLLPLIYLLRKHRALQVETLNGLSKLLLPLFKILLCRLFDR